MRKKYSAAIFDLDGTLVNSLADIADSMNRILESEGFQTYDTDDYRFFVGNGIRRLVENCIPKEKRNAETVERCLALMIEDYGANCVNKSSLYEGISELLAELAARGTKMSVLSNKAEAITAKVCRRLLPVESFVEIRGASEQFPRKPSPEAALFIASRMEVEPSEIFYLGDTSVDMHTARAAGFFPAGALWGFRSAGELLEAGAEVLIKTPSDCLNYFTT
ncbi:MAG: HAD family hydrolase [Prevotellaceae bacterium]|jgi:phosphoglycolate phosphatase|nr:HAD family hydrolase [Prevotellaceae bacterium]